MVSTVVYDPFQVGDNVCRFPSFTHTKSPGECGCTVVPQEKGILSFWTKGVMSWITFLSCSSCPNVREHLTGGFLCAVLDPSGILCSLLIPEYSGIKRRGKPLLGGWGIQAFHLLVFLYSDKYPLPFYEPYGKSDYLQPSLFHMDDPMFPCKFWFYLCWK